MWWTRNDIREGMLVTSVAGQRLGKVIRCDADTFIIEKGVFFPKDYELRYDHITDVSDGTISYLLSDENALRGSEAKAAGAAGGAGARLKAAIQGGKERARGEWEQRQGERREQHEERQARTQEQREEHREEQRQDLRQEERHDAGAEQPIAREQPPVPADRWADRDDRLEEERLTSGGERERPIRNEELVVGRQGQPNPEEAREEARQAAPQVDDDMITEEISVFREEVVVRTIPQSKDAEEHPPAPRTPPSGQGSGAPSVR